MRHFLLTDSLFLIWLNIILLLSLHLGTRTEFEMKYINFTSNYLNYLIIILNFTYGDSNMHHGMHWVQTYRKEQISQNTYDNISHEGSTQKTKIKGNDQIILFEWKNRKLRPEKWVWVSQVKNVDKYIAGGDFLQTYIYRRVNYSVTKGTTLLLEKWTFTRKWQLQINKLIWNLEEIHWGKYEFENYLSVYIGSYISDGAPSNMKF